MVEVLIGADYLWLFQEGRTVRGSSDEPIAVETKLGWVLSRSLKDKLRADDDGLNSVIAVKNIFVASFSGSRS